MLLVHDGRRSSRNDCRAEVGDIISIGKGAYYVRVIESIMWYDDDYDQWYESYWAVPATEAEAQPLRERREASAAAASTAKRLRAIHDIVLRGTPVEGPSSGREVWSRTPTMGTPLWLRVDGDTLIAHDPGSYDDWRSITASLTDAALAAEALRLGGAA